MTSVRTPAGSDPYGDFYLEEPAFARGVPTASPIQLANLRDLVDNILQPIRDRFGPVVPTSWTVYSSGAPRTGAHATGGAVDFQVPGASLEDVHRWAAGALWGRFGELGREPHHIHVTLPPIGGTNDVWVKDQAGNYTRPPWFYELPGIQVGGGSADPSWWALAALALLLYSGARQGRG